MFGDNPLRKREHSNGAILSVQGAPFHTIQGEGPHAGMPATFIRLWGCHLRCSFCDTDFESNRQETEVDTLVDICTKNVAPLVVLTGGEPMRQAIGPLCLQLLDSSKYVQIETAGGFWFKDDLWAEVVKHPRFTIVCSPKTPAVDPNLARVVKAWKYIVSASQQQGEDGLPITNTQVKDGKPHALARPPWTPTQMRRELIFLQPMDEYNADKNAANTELCLQLAQRHGYRISTQLHKQWGLP